MLTPPAAVKIASNKVPLPGIEPPPFHPDTRITLPGRSADSRLKVASILPINNYVTKDQADRRPPATIRALNDWMRDLARRENLAFVDYYAAMVDAHGMMKKELSDDGLHPNAAGYAVMTPLALKAITDALSGAGDSHATHR